MKFWCKLQSSHYYFFNSIQLFSCKWLDWLAVKSPLVKLNFQILPVHQVHQQLRLYNTFENLFESSHRSKMQQLLSVLRHLPRVLHYTRLGHLRISQRGRCQIHISCLLASHIMNHKLKERVLEIHFILYGMFSTFSKDPKSSRTISKENLQARACQTFIRKISWEHLLASTRDALRITNDGCIPAK